MRRLLTLVIILCALAFAPRAEAQLHWDASAGVGVMHRWRSLSTSSTQPGFGPSAELAAHLALLPLVRVGGYFGGDLSPRSSAGARTLEYGGLQATAFIPFLPRSMKGWVSLGLGYGSIYEHSFREQSDQGPSVTAGAAHGYAEFPVGLGASYTFRKPWAFYGELAGRYLFAHSQPDGGPSDRWGLGLSVGVLVEL